jgi:tetratricopeptide (TPR) repeat protein
MKKITFLIIFSLIILISGCATKVQVKSLSPGAISDGSIKNIAVLEFENDNISQSRQIESAISNLTIDGKKYFNLIDREHLDKIIKANRLNLTGLVDSKNDFKGLKEVETLVAGKIEVSDVSKTLYLETRTDYSKCVEYKVNNKGKQYCSRYETYNVKCRKNVYTLNTKVKIIKVIDSSTLFAKNYIKRKSYKHCLDDDKILPSINSVNSDLAFFIANDFIRDIAPHYVYYRVTLLDDEDIEYNKQQSSLLENAITLVENGRIDKANELLKKLNNSFNSKSYVALYNLGVTQEALGNLQNAYELYQKAENITLLSSPVDEVSNAVQRIKIELQKQKKAKAQLSN